MPEPAGGEGAAPVVVSYNWRAVGMTAGIVLVVLVCVMALSLARAKSAQPKPDKGKTV